MAEEKETKTPETEEDQDTSKLVFGKYKSMEEAEAAFKSMESERGQITERLDRTERLLALLKPDQAGTSSTSSPTDSSSYDIDIGYDDDENKRYEAMAKRIEDRVTNSVLGTVTTAMEQYEGRKSALDAFFKANPDLRDAEELVIQEARFLMQQLGNRKIDQTQAIKEVGSRVREKIAKWTKAKKEPMHLEEGRSVAPGKKETKEEEPALLSEEERLAQFMEDKRSEKEKRLGGK